LELGRATRSAILRPGPSRGSSGLPPNCTPARRLSSRPSTSSSRRIFFPRDWSPGGSGLEVLKKVEGSGWDWFTPGWSRDTVIIP